jgi:hypothetical protein
MRQEESVTSGTTSLQYFVQATTRSNSFSAAKITVALGCRQAILQGANSLRMDSPEFGKKFIVSFERPRLQPRRSG